MEEATGEIPAGSQEAACPSQSPSDLQVVQSVQWRTAGSLISASVFLASRKKPMAEQMKGTPQV